MMMPETAWNASPGTAAMAEMCIRDRLFKFQHLLRQISIPLCHLAARVMGENTFSLCADFLCTDRMGDLCAEYFDFAAIGLPQERGDLFGKVGRCV